VSVHERDGALRILGAGIYIWENGLRLLDALGVLPRVIAGAIPASCHEKRNHAGKAFASSLVGCDFRLYVPLRLRQIHHCPSGRSQRRLDSLWRRGDRQSAGAAFGLAQQRAQIQMVFQDATDSLNPRFTAFRAIADPLLRL
jgi:hypothetical protein